MMDPSLRKEKDAFKKRAIAATEKAKKSKEAAKVKVSSSVQPAQGKKVKKQIQESERAENLDRIKSAAQTAHRSNNPHRVLKSIMDMMKERYVGKNYERISLDEIFAAIGLTEIKPDLGVWVQEALASNPKVQYYPEEKYLFKPTLGHDASNRKQLLEKLRDNELKGLGGTTVSDIKEAVYNHEKALKKLKEEERIICIVRQDKEQVVFYNNPEYSLGQAASADFQGMWHRASVEATDIEKYLENVGLGAMQGESCKRKMPGNLSKKTRKKVKVTKVMNTHLATNVLKDYSSNDGEKN